jgi:CheY-like chemotaxis protein
MTHKLLLADDSVTIQRVIELTFADEDVEVTTVSDGQLAIERLDADPPDIVLADIDMPKRDGYEVAAYIKSRPELAHIPVVLLTGAFEPIDQARATAAGSSDVLAKPFEPQMVINRVKNLLGRKKDDNEAGSPPPSFSAAPPKPPAVSAAAPEERTAPQAAQGLQAQPPVSLDDYFDQLDAAFSNLQHGASPAEQSATRVDWPMIESAEMRQETQRPSLSIRPSPAPRTAEQLIAPPQGPPTVQPDQRPSAPPPAAERPVSAVPPFEQAIAAPTVPPKAPDIAATARPAPPPPAPAPKAPDIAAAARPAPPPPAPAPPGPPAPPPVVAGPASVSAAVPAAPPEGPARTPVNPFASLSAARAEATRTPAAVITEDIVEEVVKRVLERLSDRVVRETVVEIVSKTAERAVQDEIEKIKSGA